MRDKIFYFTCFGFALGVLLRSFVFVNFYTAIFAGVIAVFLLLFFTLISKNNQGIVASIFIITFSLGIIRFHIADEPAPYIYESQVGSSVEFSGEIIDEPSIKEKNISLTVLLAPQGSASGLLEAKPFPAKTEILITTDFAGDYKYGDEINFKGKLEKPENFMTDQGKEFDYVNYLRKDGIFYVMKYPKIEVISRGHGNFLKNILFSAKEKFLEKMNMAISEPESLLMGGLILGEKSSFSQALRQSFVNTGTIHIVALSGYNVTIVAEWIMKLFSFLPKNLGIGMGILSVILFIIMSGGSSTAIRAGVMAVLALFARATGRNYDVGRALVLAGIIMILFNPFVLAFDVSFQLSFIATIAVIFLSPRIEKYFLWVPKRFELRDIISVTCAAYIFVLPFILYKMGNLSLVALPANIMILPFIPITMIFGFLTGFAGIIWHFLALPFGYVSYFLLHYELSTISFFSNLPFASFSIPNFPLILTLVIYAFMLWKIFRYPLPEKKEEIKKEKKFRINDILKSKFKFLILLFICSVIILSSFYFYYSNREQNNIAEQKLQALLLKTPTHLLVLESRDKDNDCRVRGPLPDPDCSPGAVFTDKTLEQICVRGYTKTVRNVSTNLKKKIYAEYSIAYPAPKGSYEVDHIIPLELGGSNDISNLFPESAEPMPGFREKDLVENYLHQESCAGNVALSVAQYQIATDWLAVYNSLSPDQITALKNQYHNWSY
ncbi:MAG: ComEC/Rec2 family competence protein [Patescibacteria group bacterium]